MPPSWRSNVAYPCPCGRWRNAGLLLLRTWSSSSNPYDRSNARLLVALGVNQLAAAAVAEPRPYAVLDHPLLLVVPTVDPAFP
jgi:hypothetical protein